MQSTPGLRYIMHKLPTIALLSAANYLASRYLPSTPPWMLITATLVGIPSFAFLRFFLLELYHYHQARSIGAQLVPKVQGRWPGNFDILLELINYYKTGYIDDGLVDLQEKYGPCFNIRILGGNEVFTTSPEHIKAILATDFNNFEKGDDFRQKMSSMLGRGIFNSDGDNWKFHRSLSRRFFSRDRISDFEIFNRHAEEAIEKMQERFRAGYAIDFQDLASRFTLDTATEFLFGTCVNSTSAGLPYSHTTMPPSPTSSILSISDTDKADHRRIFRPSVDPNEFAGAMKDSLTKCLDRIRRGPLWPLWEVFGDLMKEDMKVVSKFIEPVVEEAIRKRKAREVAGIKAVDDEETLLDHLVQTTDDPQILKDETLNILIAGRDTTATTLTIIVYFLAMYPEVTNRLRNEILDKVGRSEKPSYGIITEMKYLRAVINVKFTETLRLYPVVPMNQRNSIKATTWPAPDRTQKPFYIPAGAECSYSVFMMHRRKDLWGPDAEEFDPDRFLDDRLKKYLVSNPLIFLPFNAGPRVCLGQQFAYNELSLMIIRLLQAFESFELDPSSALPDTLPPPEWKQSGAERRKAVEKFFPKRHLTLYVTGGLWIKAKEATNA